MKKCTSKEFQKKADHVWKQVLKKNLTLEERNILKGKLFKELYEWEIIPDFELTNNNLIDEYCIESRSTSDKKGILYEGKISNIDDFIIAGNKAGFKTCPIGGSYPYRLIMINKHIYAIATYCEHDLTIAKYNNFKDFQIAISETREFYHNN